MLKKALTQRIEIPYGDEGVVSVRGLTFAEVSQLITAHRQPISEFYDRFAGRDGEAPSGETLESAALDALRLAPALVTHIIALSADAADQLDDVAALPVDVQIEALRHTLALTFRREGGAGKLLETITAMATGTTDFVRTLRPLANGRGA